MRADRNITPDPVGAIFLAYPEPLNLFTAADQWIP